MRHVPDSTMWMTLIGRLELEDAIDDVVSWYEQMLKEAVEGQIYGSDGSHWIETEIDENLKGKEGDKYPWGKLNLAINWPSCGVSKSFTSTPN